MAALIDTVAATLLVLIVLDDLRRFRILNLPVAILAGLGLCSTALDGGAPLVFGHGLFAAAAFALLAAAFAAGMVGAGDVKLLTAACLWVGPENALVYAGLLSVLTVCYALGAALGIAPGKRVASRLKIPFGPSIAGAWIIVIALSALHKDFVSL